jgi:Uma2 family endonuclease
MASSSSEVPNMPWTSVPEYLRGVETMGRRELVYGVVREPPAPFYDHQHCLTRLTVRLTAHADEHDLGQVCVAPIDVVLDRQRALIAQPDLVFIAKDRLSIINHQIWGAPDLVVEVLSPSTARRDRTIKLGWYQKYGVRECWLVEPTDGIIEVVRLKEASMTRRKYTEGAVLRSGVLRSLRLPVSDLFGAGRAT